MNDQILTPAIQEFIDANLKTETATLLFKKHQFDDVSIKEIIEQIEAKKKCEKKLPSWFKTPHIYYPNKLNIEQTSSEITAQYKSVLCSGSTLLDITGGFGVDCYFFAKHFKHVTHCEINEQLSQIVQHNLKQLKVNNIECHAKSGIDYLKEADKQFDCIYIDPSRRDDEKNRVFFLKDCEPNVPHFLNLFFKYANTVIIKTSPLLDISSGINDLHSIKTIHCVAVNNDVKELLWVLEKNYTVAIDIQTANIKKDKTETFSFSLDTSDATHTTYSTPLSYLYEPNAAIMKSGGFLQVAEQLDVKKLHINSHLYTNDLLIDFPGRTFKIEQCLPFNKKQLKKTLPKKANITTRNFPNTVAQLRKLFNIKDGGNVYLFFTTTKDNEKVVLVCSKV